MLASLSMLNSPHSTPHVHIYQQTDSHRPWRITFSVWWTRPASCLAEARQPLCSRL